MSCGEETAWTLGDSAKLLLKSIRLDELAPGDDNESSLPVSICTPMFLRSSVHGIEDEGYACWRCPVLSFGSDISPREVPGSREATVAASIASLKACRYLWCVASSCWSLPCCISSWIRFSKVEMRKPTFREEASWGWFSFPETDQWLLKLTQKASWRTGMRGRRNIWKDQHPNLEPLLDVMFYFVWRAQPPLNFD